MDEFKLHTKRISCVYLGNSSWRNLDVKTRWQIDRLITYTFAKYYFGIVSDEHTNNWIIKDYHEKEAIEQIKVILNHYSDVDWFDIKVEDYKTYTIDNVKEFTDEIETHRQRYWYFIKD